MIWPFSLIQEKLISKYLGSMIRHGIGWLAGAMAVIAFPGVQDLAKLLTDNQDPLAASITAILSAGVALLLSFKNIKK